MEELGLLEEGQRVGPWFMSLTPDEKLFLDRILDAGYEFIDGIKDWGWDHPIPEAYRDPRSENEIVDAMRAIRTKLGLVGESAWTPEGEG